MDGQNSFDPLEPLLKALARQGSRYFRRGLLLFILFLLMSAVAISENSALFAGVAAFLGFCAWNHYMEWRRLRIWQDVPWPEDHEQKRAWVQALFRNFRRTPLWEKASNWVIACAIVVVLVGQSVFTFAVGGVWLRLLWAISCGAMILSAIAAWRYRGRRRKLPPPELWQDLT